jgi:hypothetical protein
MILIPWETGLLFGVFFMVLGFVLALAMGVIQVYWGLKKEAATASSISIPENDEEAALQALKVVENTHQKFFDAFKALPGEDQAALKGAQIAYVCDRLFKAREQIDDARDVVDGTKIVSLADPETRACTLDMIEMVEEFDKPVMAHPDFKVDPEPTRH